MKRLLLTACSFLAAGSAAAAVPRPEADLAPKPGAAVPRDVALKDESGRAVAFGDLLGRRPVLLVLAYFGCPNLCSLVLSDLVSALKPLPLAAGRDFDVAVVSIDPREGPALAAAKKESLLSAYGRPQGRAGWHVLTGPAAEVKRLADAVGFVYAYDAKSDTYQHPSVVTALTPDGRVARYLFGLGWKPRDARLALVEASEGRIATAYDRVLLLCWHYDPTTGRYGPQIRLGLRAVGAASLAGLGFIIWRAARGGEAAA